LLFRTARETAQELGISDIKLVLNETSNHDRRPQGGGKYTEQTKKLAAELYAKGLMDILGIQGHFSYNQYYQPPSIDELTTLFNSYGVPFMITEGDVNLTSVKGTKQERFNFQAEIYRRMILGCLKADRCIGINLFGGFPDSNSWYERALKQPDADATPWDDDFSRKPAYYAILKALFEGLNK